MFDSCCAVTQRDQSAYRLGDAGHPPIQPGAGLPSAPEDEETASDGGGILGLCQLPDCAVAQMGVVQITPVVVLPDLRARAILVVCAKIASTTPVSASKIALPEIGRAHLYVPIVQSIRIFESGAAASSGNGTPAIRSLYLWPLFTSAPATTGRECQHADRDGIVVTESAGSADLESAGVPGWLADLARGMARGDGDSVESYLESVGVPVTLPGTRATARTHFIVRDPTGKPRVDVLARKLAEQTIEYCIPRSRIQEAKEYYEKYGSAEKFAKLHSEARHSLLHGSRDPGRVASYCCTSYLKYR